MKTDDLIARLSDDLRPARTGLVQRWLMLGLGLGLVVCIVAMMAFLGPRPDLDAAMRLNAFWMKFFYCLALAMLGLVILGRQARAGAECRNLIWALAGPVVILIVIASVQMSARNADTAALVMGHTWMICPWRILALSLPILAALLFALKQLAPTRLTLAGASAGLVAGAVAAVVYGFHCQEMAAPFVLIWYTLGIGMAALLGALAGEKFLSW